MKTFAALTVLASLFIPLASFADWQQIRYDSFRLAPPPAPGSYEFKRDFEVLHHFQNTRSDSDCQLSQRQKYATFESFFGSADSPLDHTEANRAERLVERVMKLSEKISSYQKGLFERPRPFNVDRTLKPCAHKPGGSRAYPSTHAANATVGACVLAEIFPKKRDVLLAYGKKLGDLRVIVGVHHPSDVAAGQNLGQEFCDRLLRDSEFQRELAEVK